MAGLSAAARALATIPHRRKGVLLISQGFPATLEEIIRDPRIGAGYESIREFILTAQRSNVAVYTVDPCGLELDAGVQQRIAAESAHNRGGHGRVRRDQHECARGSRRSDACGERYLLPGWLLLAGSARTTASIIESRCGRALPDVEIRARKGYDSPGKAAKALAATPLEVLTRSAIQTRGLTMRVVAIPAPLSTDLRLQ